MQGFGAAAPRSHHLQIAYKHPYPLQEDYRRWVELVYAGDVSDFHGVRLRRYVFSQEDFRNDSAMAADFYHDNLPTCVASLRCVCLSLWVGVFDGEKGEEGWLNSSKS